MTEPTGRAPGRSWRRPAALGAVALGLGAVALVRALPREPDEPRLPPAQQAELEEMIDVGVTSLRLGKIDRAERCAVRAVELAPANPRVMAFRGQVHARRAQWEQALDGYDRALARWPEQGWLWADRGVIKRSMGDPRGAIPDLDEAIRLAPENMLALGHRGLARVETGEVEAGFEDLFRALELQQRYPPTWVRFAEARLLTGDLEGALEDAEQALELYPRSGFVWRLLATIHARRGDEALAREARERAEQLRPGIMDAPAVVLDGLPDPVEAPGRPR